MCLPWLHFLSLLLRFARCSPALLFNGNLGIWVAPKTVKVQKHAVPTLVFDRTPQFESEPKVADYVLPVSKPASVLPEHGEDELFRAVEAVEQFLLREYQDLITATEHMSLLCTYGSDCTPLRIKDTVRVSTGSLSVTCQQRLPGEWLIQRQFLRDSEGKLTLRGWPSCCVSRLQGRCFHPSAHHDDIVEFVADDRVADIAVAFFGSVLPSLLCVTRERSALHRRLRSCQAALLQILHQWLGQDRW